MTKPSMGAIVAETWNKLFQDNPTNFFNARIDRKVFLEHMVDSLGIPRDVIAGDPVYSPSQCIHNLEYDPVYLGFRCARCGAVFSELDVINPNKRVDSQADQTIHFSINNEGVAQWL